MNSLDIFSNSRWKIGLATIATSVGLSACGDIFKIPEESHKESIAQITRLNHYPDSKFEPITQKDCELLDFSRAYLPGNVKEIVIRTNIKTSLTWNGAEIISETDKGGALQRLLNKRHLAVSYKLNERWVAADIEAVKDILWNHIYYSHFPSRDGICQYSALDTRWRVQEILWLSDSPSEELTRGLNNSETVLVSKRMVWR